MLVVTRNPGESVVLTDSTGVFLAKFTYVEKCGISKVRVGIEAGLDIQIARSEIMGRPNNGKKLPDSRVGKTS